MNIKKLMAFLIITNIMKMVNGKLNGLSFNGLKMHWWTNTECMEKNLYINEYKILTGVDAITLWILFFCLLFEELTR